MRTLETVWKEEEEEEELREEFKLEKDHKGRNWLSVALDGMDAVQESDFDEVQRPDFLNFSQFCECLGHIAIAAFSHDKPEDRIFTLWKWFDQSDGTGKMGRSRNAESGIRFAIRGYEHIHRNNVHNWSS